MEIGIAIRLLRKEKKIKQKDLAKSCGISPNAFCNLEKSKSFPHKETLDKICAALNVPVSYLLLYAISGEDVPEDKKRAFNILINEVKKFLLS